MLMKSDRGLLGASELATQLFPEPFLFCPIRTPFHTFQPLHLRNSHRLILLHDGLDFCLCLAFAFAWSVRPTAEVRELGLHYRKGTLDRLGLRLQQRSVQFSWELIGSVHTLIINPI